MYICAKHPEIFLSHVVVIHCHSIISNLSTTLCPFSWEGYGQNQLSSLKLVSSLLQFLDDLRRSAVQFAGNQTLPRRNKKFTAGQGTWRPSRGAQNSGRISATWRLFGGKTSWSWRFEIFTFCRLHPWKVHRFFPTRDDLFRGQKKTLFEGQNPPFFGDAFITKDNMETLWFMMGSWRLRGFKASLKYWLVVFSPYLKI